MVMKNTTYSTRGFTIVELLIVIVVIGVLAALTITGMQSAQVRARDSERQTDVAAIAKALEAYYTEYGAYPRYTGLLDSTTWISSNLKSLASNAIIAPKATSGTTNSITHTASPTTSQYGYQLYASDHTTGCTIVNNHCPAFTLLWREERTNQIKTLRSLNTQ